MNTLDSIQWPARTGAAIQTTPEDERVASEVKQALMRSKWEAEEQMTPLAFWDWVCICVVMAACMFAWVMVGRWWAAS